MITCVDCHYSLITNIGKGCVEATCKHPEHVNFDPIFGYFPGFCHTFNPDGQCKQFVAGSKKVGWFAYIVRGF